MEWKRFGAVALIIQLSLVSLVTLQSTLRTIQDAEWINHTKELTSSLNRLLGIIGLDAASHRGYLMTGDEAFLEPHKDSRQEVAAELEKLRPLVASSPSQLAKLDRMALLIDERLSLADRHRELLRREGFEAVRERVRTGKGQRVLQEIFAIADEMAATEHSHLSARVQNSSASALSAQRAVIIGAVLTLTLSGIGLWALRRDQIASRTRQEELRASEERLKSFNSQLEASVAERTATLEAAMQTLRGEIAERQRLEEEILEMNERQQKRIGQDLHDDLGQQLTAISMLASQMSDDLIADCASTSIQTMRNLAKSYFPIELERGGLVAALEDLAKRTRQIAKVQCDVAATADFLVEKTAEIHLYRIAQESVSNSIKHGNATRIEIRCFCEGDHCLLTISDNGSGFVPPKEGTVSGMGLHLFQYRARLIGGSLTVDSGTGSGCTITCTIPRARPAASSA